MQYWLDLFTGETWQEFMQAGASVTGFSPRRWKLVQHIQPGDRLICYVTGISRYTGLLEVVSEPFWDETERWASDLYPCRLKVKPIIALTLEQGVLIKALADRLSYFRNLKRPNLWNGWFRGSPARVKAEDAECIVAALEEAQRNPVARPFDQRLIRIRPTRRSERESPQERQTQPLQLAEREAEQAEQGEHERIQRLLLELGSSMGLDAWVARNDRGRFQNMPRLRTQLPQQFDPVSNRTIELIDVLWLEGSAIVCAFEVEHTSSIYSGLLRMSDLLAMQPNLSIRLYLVAPDERREAVKRELNRPTFARARKPLSSVCKFIPYSRLRSEVEQLGERTKFLNPLFVDSIAEDLTEPSS